MLSATLIGFLLYLFNLGGPILSLVSGTTALQQGLGALARIEEVREMETEDDVDLTPARPPARRRKWSWRTWSSPTRAVRLT
ncbi:ABC transporter ATP-binding protein [Streptomyces lunaelactis]|uniref:ABC transporter ATP-binding protein n=1 Tax=Streptomyces lunaelactis TaxID=1535768 RepID=UPI000D395C77|nr:ABC transporter ATP-binding protein [Streptomyces lunaelactis]